MALMTSGQRAGVVPVAWMWELLEGSPINKNKGAKSGVYLEDPAGVGIDINSDKQRENYRWTLLYAAPHPVAPPAVVPDGWRLIPVSMLVEWKSAVNNTAALSLKAERYRTGAALKQRIADTIAAAPQPAAQIAEAMPAI